MYKFILILLLVFTYPLLGEERKINEIIELINHNQNQEALQLLNKIEKSISTNEKYLIFYYRGKIYFHLKDYQQAIDNFIKVTELNPNWYLIYHELGLTYLTITNREKARNHFQKTIQLNRMFTLAYYHLGNTFLLEKKYNEAIKNYLLNIKYEKDKGILSNSYLGLGNAQQGLNKRNDAVESFKQSIHFNNNWKAHMNLGLIYFKQDLFPEAINSFQQVLLLKKDYSEAYFYLGNSYRGLKQFEEMEQYYLQALSITSNYKEVLYSLSSYYALKNKKELMLKYLSKLFSVDVKYKNIILNENLFKTYKNDPDFKRLIGG